MKKDSGTANHLCQKRKLTYWTFPVQNTHRHIRYFYGGLLGLRRRSSSQYERDGLGKPLSGSSWRIVENKH